MSGYSWGAGKISGLTEREASGLRITVTFPFPDPKLCKPLCALDVFTEAGGFSGVWRRVELSSVCGGLRPTSRR